MLTVGCTVATNCDCIYGIVDICGLVFELQTWRSITNGLSEVQLKTREGSKAARESAHGSELIAYDSGI